jgi:RNA polymerase sigma-70 factor (family 1)
MTQAAGMEEAFKALFHQEYSGLCRYAVSYLKDSYLAEDVVQETFIKIWEKKQEMIASADLRFYLVTAVRNNCINVLRKQKAQPLTLTEHTHEPEPEIQLTAMQHKELADERARKISQALELLPPKCREVFLLVKMQGMSYKQVADLMDISQKTVENQMGKALKTLREGVLLELLLLSAVWLPEMLRRPAEHVWHPFFSIN